MCDALSDDITSCRHILNTILSQFVIRLQIKHNAIKQANRKSALVVLQDIK